MSAIRVIHQFAPSAVSPADLDAYATTMRSVAGVREAEAYVALDDASRLALLELWEDEAAYATHWAAVVKAGPGDDLVLGASLAGNGEPSEFYAHRYFNRDRVWVADCFNGAPPAIFWPAAGGVRIALQMCLVDSPDVRAGFTADAQRTRLEPGCLHYGWYHGIGDANYYCLLELWTDQFIYDNHWNLRIKTAAAGGGREMATRERGTNGIEFYRHQPFRHLYDRWLPADPKQWSETIVWPS